MKDSLKTKNLTKKITVIFLFGIICIVFVFFGLPQQMGPSTGGTAAIVNNEIISLREWQTEVQRLQQFYDSFLQGASFFTEEHLQNQAINSLINGIATFHKNKDEHIYTTNEEVKDYIINEINVFQENNIFQRELYNKYLDQLQLSPGEFERKVRIQLSNQKTQNILEQINIPLKIEEKIRKKIYNISLNIKFAKIEKEINKNEKGDNMITNTNNSNSNSNSNSNDDNNKDYSKNISLLKKVLKEKKYSKINNILKRMGIEWQETGEFNFESESIPKLGKNKRIIDEIFQLTKPNEISNKLIEDGNKFIIVQLKSLKKEENKDKNFKDEINKIAQSRKYELTSAWNKQVIKKSKVTKNEQIFGSESEQKLKENLGVKSLFQ